ncbi:MAG TPA: pitrilysin family protein, partial [Candidatus Paceibacterota bacterium]|nr:pitrilysin family protein [Candidatus Paceibacterota bacterium]
MIKPTKTVLPNGLRIIAIPKPEAPAVTVMVLAEAGSKYEAKEESGLSHFIEHVLFKGTPKRPKAFDISSELDALGAQSNAFTSQEYTGYYATVWPKRFGKALDVISDIYLNPLFDAEEIEKEKGVIIEEINMYEDNPARQVRDLFNELLHGDQPAGWSVLGTREHIKAMRRDQFVSYHQSHYVASSTVVVISGSFDQETALKQIAKKFSAISQSLPAAKEPTLNAQQKPAILVRSKDSDQAHLVLGFKAYDLFDKREPAVDLLATVLGGGMSSRLFQKIREEMGAAYYVRAANDTLTDHGALEIGVGADTKRAKEVVKVILEECRRIAAEPLPAPELSRVKDYIAGNLYLDLET